tara:strand:- start:3757 stop:4716 length:960 start_codon:yes stop_codon:yes gene_type:complete
MIQTGVRTLRHICRPALASLLATGTLLFASAAHAQVGTLDQLAPDLGSTFNLTSAALTWQQEVRSELGGLVTEVEVIVDGPAGAAFDLRLRRGQGWNTSDFHFATSITLPVAGVQPVLVDVSAATLVLGDGGAMVIELQGVGDAVFVRGSYIDPNSGGRAYPHPLFLNGPGCYSDCGWRMAFRSFVDPAGGSFPYCSSTPNSTGSAAQMSLVGSPSIAANDVVLRAQPTPNEPGLFIMGAGTSNLPLGPGTLCVPIPFRRLKFAFGVNNVMDFSVNLNLLPPAYAVMAGEVWNFQAYYRDPSVPPGFNLSNGLHILFAP